jgi:hypothetical protein
MRIPPRDLDRVFAGLELFYKAALFSAAVGATIIHNVLAINTEEGTVICIQCMQN